MSARRLTGGRGGQQWGAGRVSVGCRQGRCWSCSRHHSRVLWWGRHRAQGLPTAPDVGFAVGSRHRVCRRHQAQGLPSAPAGVLGTPGAALGREAPGGPHSVGAGMKSDIVPPNKVNFLISP